MTRNAIFTMGNFDNPLEISRKYQVIYFQNSVDILLNKGICWSCLLATFEQHKQDM